ncbi:unnamed protein product [Lactuca saligna]|uniref:Uncharacterized protein n=1 Tax=Lactuca saligna TaxID=75948 RepID=A0AA35ZGK7_LACSI|nr:unnamed protein product [Lactuca saligna]
MSYIILSDAHSGLYLNGEDELELEEVVRPIDIDKVKKRGFRRIHRELEEEMSFKREGFEAVGRSVFLIFECNCSCRRACFTPLSSICELDRLHCRSISLGF